MTEGFDVIGDIHGMGNQLELLLYTMGYRKDTGVWSHPNRRVAFVGDLIDRGPEQMQTIHTVRRMVEAGTAFCVQGNHEFNALSYSTRHPHKDDWLRTRKGERGPNNAKQHIAFIKSVGLDTGLHKETTDWFRTLPLWLDLGGVRVVHACWDNASMAALEPIVDEGNLITDELLIEASEKDSRAYLAIENVLKGPEIDLKQYEVSYKDQEGIERTAGRYKWWMPETFLPDALEVPGSPELPEVHIDPPVEPYQDNIPVLFGHYWRSGDLRIDTPKASCVDYSACRSGPLVAYRWSGEEELDKNNLFSANY